jgi:hypothetical protein
MPSNLFWILRHFAAVMMVMAAEEKTDCFALSQTDCLGTAQADCLGNAQVNCLGTAKADCLGTAQVNSPGTTQADSLGTAQADVPAAVQTDCPGTSCLDRLSLQSKLVRNFQKTQQQLMLEPGQLIEQELRAPDSELSLQTVFDNFGNYCTFSLFL